MSSGSPSYMYEAINMTNDADLTASTPRSFTCWYSTLEDIEAQAVSAAKLKEEEKQKKKDEAKASVKVSEYSARALSEEAAESNCAYSSEESAAIADFMFTQSDDNSDASYESGVEVSDEEGGS